MTLDSYTEDEVVGELTRDLPTGAEVIVGAGDDCAVLGRIGDERWRLLKTDCVVEEVHFQPGEAMRRVGWKALCRAISDIAAMGGVPREALVTLAISPREELLRAKDLYAGLNRAARAFGVAIVGGETSRSPGPMFVSITLTGEVERERCTLRSGGQAGDALYVTGRLGGSLGGKHLDFTPRLAEARWLTEHFRVGAMMDLSDGLTADLPRLAEASHCSFELAPDRVPIARGCTLEQALGDGEDFELLMAIRPDDETRLAEAWEKRFSEVPLTRVGRLTEYNPEVVGSWLPPGGYDHFQQG